MKLQTLLISYLFIMTFSTSAQIATDGSLGPLVNLPGPDYQITADLGQQYGGNLFHSFQDFNLQSFETATFSGATQIENVMTRVTGGNLSNIDGTIRSLIPNANFYFLNPYGIVFGPNAKLDVSGSFHASTADYLRFADDKRFVATQPDNHLLTVAPVEAFGFLDHTIAAISVTGPGKIMQTEPANTGLRVPVGKMLSLMGGAIDLNKGYFFETVTDEQVTVTRLPLLAAPAGQINLASVASSGEIRLGDGFLDVSSLMQFADMSISDQSLVTVSGPGNGKLLVRGQHLLINNSKLESQTLGEQDNALVDIQVGQLSLVQKSQIDARTEGKGSDIQVNIQAKEAVNLLTGSNINVSTYNKEEGAGDAGMVLIEAPTISIIDSSGIFNSTFGSGNAGDVIIHASEQFTIEKASNIYISPYSPSTGGNGGRLQIIAKDVLVAGGSYLSGTTFGPGKGGDITIIANGRVTLSEANSDGFVSGLFTNSNPRYAVADDAGNIVLEAKELVIEKGAMISSSTIARPDRRSGQGGNITLRVHGLIKLDGVNLYGENSEGFGSGIYVRAKGEQTGAAGQLEITAQGLFLTDGAVIESSTDSQASGGQINIQVDETLLIAGNSSQIILREPAGSQKNFQTDFPNASTGVSVSGISGSSESTAPDAGMAGDIVINANAILIKSGLINTSTQNAEGGNISLMIPGSFILQEQAKITTSVQGGNGNGGNITLANPNYILLDQSQIKAQANQGQGGNIHIVTEHFIRSPTSLVSASSRLGVDGQVEIESPDNNITEGITTLSSEIFDARTLLKKSCDTMTYEDYENRSSFKVHPIAGHPTSPFALQPSRLSLPISQLTNQNQLISHVQQNKPSLITCRFLEEPLEIQTVEEKAVIPVQLF